MITTPFSHVPTTKQLISSHRLYVSRKLTVSD